MLEVEFEHDAFPTDSKGKQAEIDAAIIAFLNDIGDKAKKSFEAHVPLGTTGRLHEAVHKDRVEKSPGGFSVSVGIRPIEPDKPGESPNYPLFVDKGTGEFGDDPHLIYPEHGNVMVFKIPTAELYAAREGLFGDVDAGETSTIVTRWVKGQEGQHFSDLVEQEMIVYFKLKKRELAKVLAKILAN